MVEAAAGGPVRGGVEIRALAHPVRWKLLDVLTAEGTVTATRCAELTGESTATCSYHLGILAKYGYITRVPGAQWREKPWRLVQPDIRLPTDGGDEGLESASRAVAGSLVEFELGRLRDDIRRGEQLPAGWRGTRKIMVGAPRLTAAEARQAIAEISQVIDKYGELSQAPERPEDARPVRLFAAVAPMTASQPGD